MHLLVQTVQKLLNVKNLYLVISMKRHECDGGCVSSKIQTAGHCSNTVVPKVGSRDAFQKTNIFLKLHI